MAHSDGSTQIKTTKRKKNGDGSLLGGKNEQTWLLACLRVRVSGGKDLSVQNTPSSQNGGRCVLHIWKPMELLHCKPLDGKEQDAKQAFLHREDLARIRDEGHPGSTL